MKYAKQYGFKVASPCIAQACIESAFGTSNKAKHHNYFGLKYRDNRLTCHSGKFSDSSAEQNDDGSYYGINDYWFEFASMEKGVEGYFQFINIDHYAEVKKANTPISYLEAIKDAGYATAHDYVSAVNRVIIQYNLTQYDSFSDWVINNMSSEINIIQNTGFQGYNVSTRSVPPKFIVIHYVGAGGSAKNNVAYFNGGNRQASADFFVDENNICQYNPDINEYNTWHCGGGLQSSSGHSFYGICTNGNSIGIEMCCYEIGDDIWRFKPQTITNTVNLVKYLMNEFNIPVSNVIRHFDVTGKYCPGVDGWIPTIESRSEIAWNGFKAQLGGTIPSVVKTEILKKGASGESVETLQLNLVAIGYSIEADGDFGAKTEAAVKDFQKKYNLEVDGIVGQQTKDKMSEVIKALTKPTAKTEEINSGKSSSNELKKGMRNSAVKALQQKLVELGYAITPDGRFGPNTDRIVREFQAKYNLLVDGIVGENTMDKINYLLAEKSVKDNTDLITDVSKPEIKYVGKVTANKLNVREGAGLNYNKVAAYPVLEKGNLVDVYDEIDAEDGSRWLYIRIGGKIFGYVSADYIAH